MEDGTNDLLDAGSGGAYNLIDEAASNNLMDGGMCLASNLNSLIRSQVRTVQVANHRTDIAVMDFADKLFLVVSQYEKMGTLVLITKDSAPNTEPQEPVYTTKVLFGKDEAEVHAAARHLATIVDSPKSILLGLALKDFSPNTVRLLAKALLNQVTLLGRSPS
uniref:Putative proteasome assembly chaperone n=1 Tax=Ixodes ricinus TaxID=34613 RepID=A0A131YA39_IXORI